MKKLFESKYIAAGIVAFVVIACSMLLFFLIFRLDDLGNLLGLLVGVLAPVIFGLIIAYLLNPVMNFFERKVFARLVKKSKHAAKWQRALGLTAAILMFLLILAFLIYMIIPQVAISLAGIASNMTRYINNFSSWLTETVGSNSHLAELVEGKLPELTQYLQEFSNNYMPYLNQIVDGLTKGVLGAFTALKNFLVGIIVAVYLLYSREKFIAQCKKVFYAVFPQTFTQHLLAVLNKTHKTFSGFISGKILDSTIIGILCFIGMSIFKMPFPLLISVIVGVTNVIPFFGPFIGAIPSAILILFVDPLECLWFVLFVLVLQQFDGNILGPKILGDSTGLPAFWVIFAILVGGGLFGVVGMFIGVPTFAVIYMLFRAFIAERLSKKGLSADTADYWPGTELSADSLPVNASETEKQ